MGRTLELAADFYKGTRFPRTPDGRPIVSRQTFYSLLREGRFPWVTRFGRRLFVDLEKFETWLDEGGDGLGGLWRRQDVLGVLREAAAEEEAFVGSDRG